MTRAGFEQWLELRGSEYVGRPRSPVGCPVVVYLDDTGDRAVGRAISSLYPGMLFQAVWAQTVMTEIRRRAWARAFVTEIDKFDADTITGDEALEILDNIPR